MSPSARAFYGALCGALLTLFIHPVSRPYMLASFMKWGPCSVFASSYWIPENAAMLPQPSEVLESSLWMQAGAERLVRRQGLSEADLDKLVRVAQMQAEDEPQNAFWRQMEAVFLWESGDREKAAQAWLRAANADRWNDYQGQRLTLVAQEMARRQGASQSWQMATVYHAHSTAVPRAIEMLSRSILATASMDDPEGLRLRYATLTNGKLMRDGSRSVAGGDIATHIVELSTYTTLADAGQSPRRLLLARYALINALREGGMPQQAENAEMAFLQNEGWLALTQQGEPNRHAQLLTVGSIFASTVPSVFVIGAIAGALIWLLGVAMKRSSTVQAVFQPPIAPALGVILAVVVYFLTKLPMAALATVACFSFLAFRPDHERSRPTQDLGPAFQFTLILLALSFILMLGAFLIGVSTPGYELLADTGVPNEFFGGSTLFLGLTGIVLGLLLLSAPSWAIVQRIPTPKVVSLTFRNFGAGLGVTCLLLSVVSAPIAIYFDRQMSETLTKLVQNEPVFYLVQ
jgi:hypothetical protein